MNRCAPAAHAHGVSPRPARPGARTSLWNRGSRLACRTKCFSHPSTCEVSLSLPLPHSGLISFDGKMNVIIARKKSPSRCPFPGELFRPSVRFRHPLPVLHMPPCRSKLSGIVVASRCSHAGRLLGRHGNMILNLFVCAAATHGAARRRWGTPTKGCEAALPSLGHRLSSPARRRQPSQSAAARRRPLMLQDTLWLSR